MSDTNVIIVPDDEPEPETPDVVVAPTIIVNDAEPDAETPVEEEAEATEEAIEFASAVALGNLMARMDAVETATQENRAAIDGLYAIASAEQSEVEEVAESDEEFEAEEVPADDEPNAQRGEPASARPHWLFRKLGDWRGE